MTQEPDQAADREERLVTKGTATHYWLDSLDRRRQHSGMPRLARAVVPSVPHHGTQRGNSRQDVFFVNDDRRSYLDVLAEQAHRFALRVMGYCLTANHVRLVVVSEREVAECQPF